MSDFPNFLLVPVLVFSLSAATCALTIHLCRRWPRRLVRAGDVGAVQRAHDIPTPRIGGVAILVGIIASVVLAPSGIAERYFILSLTLLPVVVPGISEDLGLDVRPLWRLLGAAAASLAVIGFLEIWVSRTGIPGLDQVVQYAPVGILLTVFVATGICHAFNLLDGMNGLASGTAILIALALALISRMSGEMALAQLDLMLLAAIVGFFIFNYPGGRIFLGDGGAYVLGHVLVWFAFVLIIRVESFAPPALLLIFFWPVADTLLAIYRRSRSNRPVGAPDRLHFHQLVMRALEIRFLGRGRRNLANPATTAVMLPFVAAPIFTGVVVFERPLAAWAAVVVYAVLFVGSYIIGMRFAAGGLRTRTRFTQAAQA